MNKKPPCTCKLLYIRILTDWKIKVAYVHHGLLILPKITTKGPLRSLHSPLIPRAQVISTSQLSDHLAQEWLHYSTEEICEIANFTDMFCLLRLCDTSHASTICVSSLL